MCYSTRIAIITIIACLTTSMPSSTTGVNAPDPLRTPRTPGELVIQGKDAKPAGACPLRHTDVRAQVSGFIARVRVVQKFHNPTSEKIEAIYTFPLPDNSAVDFMEMKVGERTIVGEIRPREEAREIYEAAKESGHIAGLLDQERPNIFTQSVANIEPGARVEIAISYTQLLKYEAGTYEFVFPMVVGPRFSPGAPTGHQGAGRTDDTTSVPDASKITPQITPKGTRAGHDISMRIDINAAIPISNVRSVSHQIELESPSDILAQVKLKDRATIPNKDFVLRYDVAGEMVSSGMITSAPGGKGGYFALVMQPPKTPKPKFVTPKEMIFVIDTSGSQMGEPMAKSKETMLHCIKNVNPNDTFNMISFSSSVRKLFEKPRPYTSGNLDAALKFLKECDAGGGTVMLPAIKEAMSGPYDSERLRTVVFFTDGYIGNDFEIVDHIQKNSAHARVFAFGIGSGVNRFLIEKMAEAGRGSADVVLLNSDSQEVARKFYDKIRNPLLTDISVDWGSLPVVAEEVYPRRVPDLFSAQPLILKGYYTTAASGQVTIRGKVNGDPWVRVLDVELPDIDDNNDALASIWARSKVDDLMSNDWLGAQSGNPDPKTKDKVVELALQYNLMTQYTSFVAVERMVVTSGGHPTTISVPVEMPEGVSYEGVLGEGADGLGLAGGLAFGYGGYGGTSGAGRGLYARSKHAAPGRPAASLASIALSAFEALPKSVEPADSAVPLAAVADDVVAAEDADATIVRQRLDKTLVELVEKYKKDGGSGSYSAPGRLLVKEGKVQVMIWLKGDAKDKLAQIETLGLTDYTWALEGRMLVGWAPIAKLEELARLDFVTRIAPPDYAK